MKTTYIYHVVHTSDKQKFREDIQEYSDQGFELDQMDTCMASSQVYFTAVMRKRPEAPVIDTGPGTDPTGGTPAAGRVVVPFRTDAVRRAA